MLETQVQIFRSRSCVQKNLACTLLFVAAVFYFLGFPSQTDVHTALIFRSNPWKTVIGIGCLILSTSLWAFISRLSIFLFAEKFWKENNNSIKKQDLLLAYVVIVFTVVGFFYLKFLEEDFEDSIIQACNFAFIVVCAGMLLACLGTFSDYDDAEICESQNSENSIGALWAYSAYESYYKLTLLGGCHKNILRRMRDFEEDKKITFLVKKLVLICPLSCDIQGDLCSKDGRISHFGNLEVLENDQGANINRRYKNSVYCIDQQNKSYVVAEYPSSLGTLYKTKNMMNADIWKYHRDCIIQTLKLLLKNKPCIILDYDDSDENLSPAEPLSDFLQSALSDHLRAGKFIDVLE